MVAVAGFVVLSGQTGIPLYISALAVLGGEPVLPVRGLGAGTPHVVSHDKLVMANAVVPTAGTILGFVGGVVGLGVHFISGGGLTGSACVLWFGGACYLVAGLLGTRMDKDLLGPLETEKAQAKTNGLAAELGGVVRGLVAGIKHLNQRRKGRLRARRGRRASRALRHPAGRGAAALPQLLLPRRQRQQGPRPRHAARDHQRDRIRPGRLHHPAGRQAGHQGQLDHHLAADRRRGDDHARPDLQPVRLPATRLRARPVRPVREDLRGHDRPADRGRPVHGPRVLALRHALQRRLRVRPRDRGAVPARQRQVLRGGAGHRGALPRRGRRLLRAHAVG